MALAALFACEMAVFYLRIIFPADVKQKSTPLGGLAEPTCQTWAQGRGCPGLWQLWKAGACLSDCQRVRFMWPLPSHPLPDPAYRCGLTSEHSWGCTVFPSEDGAPDPCVAAQGVPGT